MKASVSPHLSNLRIALVLDDLIQKGGAEQLFLAIAELFSNADIFTSSATKEWLSRFEKETISKRKIFTSFMQRLPFKENFYRHYFSLYPLAFESFDLSSYDLVISHTARFAFGVITKPGTVHICYVNNPGRMFWEPENYFGSDSKIKILLSPILSYLRLWSFTAAQRVDYFIGNSNSIARKIKKYFGREASVVYPFVDLEKFRKPSFAKATVDRSLDNYFLVVTRLNRWKRVDLAIEAVQRLGVPLKIVGTGPDQARLERLAARQSKKLITFLGSVSGEELVTLYRNCKALIMTQEEDFGIAALEAQATGRPVIAYGAGGALETVIEGKTGEFFYPQKVDELSELLSKFKSEIYDPHECQKNAQRFSKEEFKKQYIKEVEVIINELSAL